MQVYIDTFRAQNAVQSISDRARTIMNDSENLLKQVRRIGNGMQTEHADQVLKTVKQVEEDLSLLRSEMIKLQAYMQELSTYIANYSRCSYHQSVMTTNYANVDTYEVYAYLNNTKEVTGRAVSFQNVFDDEYVRIRQQLDSGIYKLDENRSKCTEALSALTEKIEHAQHKLQELEMKLAQLERRLRELQARIQELLRKAQSARAAAAAVHVPPLRTWTDEDGNVHDNSAEVHAAMQRKQQLLNEAAHYEAETARLQAEANLVAQEIAEVRSQIEYVRSVLAQMRATQSELKAHLAELAQRRQALSDCRNTMRSIHSSCMEQCATVRKECADAEQKLTQAVAELDRYTSALISDPALKHWRLF